MKAQDESGDQSVAQFGGCKKLAEQYQLIGRALGEIDKANGRFGSISLSSLKHFRQSVALITVEVLESYLEDLLNLEVSEEELYIEIDRLGNKILLFSLLGLVGSAVCGVYAASTGANFVLSLALALCLASPFAVLWHFSPRETTVRRMRYAQIVTHEISKRRGGGKGAGRMIVDKPTLLETLIGSRIKDSGALTQDNLEEVTFEG